LGERGVGVAVNYRAVHTLTYYRERFALPPESLPVAYDFGERTISLPLWPDLPLDDVDYVCDALEAALAQFPDAAR
jgi:dTDP-4-amino-4,6-dideoxygalactose transaminase